VLRDSTGALVEVSHNLRRDERIAEPTIERMSGCE
jgi:hypothetical protein